MQVQKPRTLEEYPIVIEPLSEVLEIKVKYGDHSQWERLQRWRVDPELAPTVVGNLQAAHVFGNADTMELGKLALAYDAQGILRSLWCVSLDRGWVAIPALEEINGEAVRLPSVRHTFVDAESQKRYVNLLELMLRAFETGSFPSKNTVAELLTLLLSSPTPMTVFDVSNAPVKLSTKSLSTDIE